MTYGWPSLYNQRWAVIWVFKPAAKDLWNLMVCVCEGACRALQILGGDLALACIGWGARFTTPGGSEVGGIKWGGLFAHSPDILGLLFAILATLRRLREPCPAPAQLSSLMSLDFFFVPLATKAGASLDQVKASREGRSGRILGGANFSFSLPAHHMSACGISPRQRIHTDTSHTADSQTSFQHLHCVILLYTGA